MRKFFLFKVLLFSIALKSQGGFQKIQIKSPQSYAFEKYGNVPTNLYIGSIDLIVPITSIDENGVNIPVSLSYDSSGFIPHKKPDLAGINWSLLAGGRITRTVNGIPDEYIGDALDPLFGDFYGYSKRYSGFMVGVKNSPYSNSSAFNLQFGPGIVDPPGEESPIAKNFVFGPPNKAYEGEPDLFNFSVMGFSGKFMMGNDGKVMVESDDPNVQVDMSKMNTYSATNFCGNDLTSSIKITDGKGNQYIFGGDLSKFELSYPTKDILFSEGFNGVPAINSFSISKIILANGKIIDFDYYNPNLSYNFCHNPYTEVNITPSREPLFSVEAYYQQGTVADNWTTCTSPFPYQCAPEGQSIAPSQEFVTLLKKSLLTSIRCDGNEIKINYKSLGYPVKPRYAAPKYLNEWVIDNIETYSNSKLLKSTTFTYDNFGGNFQRPFLKSVKENETNKEYSFEYTGTYNLPPYYTKGVDHWGYWNGNDSNPYLAPYSSYNGQTGDYDLVSTFRDPSPVFYSATLLSKIVYPTKGSTEFEYEPNDYSQRIERTSTSLFHPAVQPKQGTAGGARIHKIKNYSATGILSTEKEYLYINNLPADDGGTTVSSGMLMNWPRYHYYFEFNYGFSKRILILTSSSNHQTNSLDSYNVGYSTVFEIEKNNGYKEYNFTDYNTNPDDYNFEFDGESYLNTIKFSNLYADEDIQPLNLYRNFQNLYGTDKSITRGKLSYEKFYKQSSAYPQKVIHYDYYDNEMYNNNASDAESNYVTIYHISGLWAQAYKRFFNISYLRTKTVTEYDDNGNELQWANTEYLYNSTHTNNLSEEKTTFSDNSEVKTTYKYAKDLLIGDPYQPSSYPTEYMFISSLFRKNMLSIPLVITNYKNNKFLRRSQTLYKFDSNLTIPTLPSKDLFYTQDIASTMGGVNGSYIVPTVSSATELLSYDQYDDKSNLIQYTSKAGIPTAIIWGYNQSQPIAKIEGATYAQVSSLATSIVTASNADANQAPRSDESAFLTVLDTFRNNPALVGFQVTTYTYDPSIGVRSITPPSGVREVYIYDTGYKLQEIRDINGNILKSYEYHYKP